MVVGGRPFPVDSGIQSRRGDDYNDNDRPSKRFRKSSDSSTNTMGGGFDDVYLLNQCGISKMQSGMDEEAEKFFSLALGQHATKSMMTMTTSQQHHTDDVSTASVRLPPGQESVSTFGVVSDTIVESDGKKNRVVSSEATYSYMYQRHLYDEGMYHYSEALSLDRDSTESIRSAVLLYNVAQTHVRRCQYNDAYRCYELAMLKIQEDRKDDNDNDSAASDAASASVNTTTAVATVYSVKINHNMGYCLYQLHQNADAMKCYEMAADTIQEGGLDDSFFPIINNSIAVLLFHRNPLESANSLTLFEDSLQYYKEDGRGIDTKHAATVLNNIGRVHFILGDYERALTVYEDALNVRLCVLGKSSVDVAATLCNIGQTLHQLGRLDDAMKRYVEFLDLAHELFGPCHRDIAIIYKCIAEIHHERRQLSAAEKMYGKSLQLGRAALGEKHPDLVSTLIQMGNLQYELNRYDVALSYYDQGLTIERSLPSPTNSQLVVMLMNVAQVHRQNGDYASALARYKEVHQLQTLSHGDDSLQAANSCANIALMYYHLKSYPTAFELYQEALRIQRDRHGSDDNSDVASTLNAIGLVLFSQGSYDLAKTCFSDSLSIRTRLLGRDHHEVAVLWYNIATIHLEAGDDERAISMFKETLRVERVALGPEHDDVILTLQHLGLVFQQRGELEEALRYFGEALTIETTRKCRNALAIAKLMNLMGNIFLQHGRVDEMMEYYSGASRIYREHHNNNGIASASSSPSSGDNMLIIAGFNFYGLSKLHPPCAAAA